ncbi:hypothetical protein HDU76_010355, partial [Blyttiomyces sp. JEL0837]
MGQYYMLINVDKKEALPAIGGFGNTFFFDAFTSGMKMVEQMFNLGTKPMLALSLVTTSTDNPPKNKLWGSWSGDRIVLIGDYSDDCPSFITDAEAWEMEALNPGLNLYGFASESYRSLDHREFFQHNEELVGLFSHDDGSKAKHVVVNLDTREYLDPVAFDDEPCVDQFSMSEGGVMKGLYSCLFYSTGSGGGDVEGFHKGRWAG